jgi:hypothetical protein
MTDVLHQTVFDDFNYLLFSLHLCIGANDGPEEISKILIEQLIVRYCVLYMQNALY